MGKKTKVYCIIALIVLLVLSFCAACSSGGGVTGDGEPYAWTFDKPFAGTPDADMTIDGSLDEAAWQNKKWLSQTVLDKTWAATTHFTSRGLYVAVRVSDATMRYVTRYTDRSAVSLYLCKEGEQTWDTNNLSYHPTRCQRFSLDPYYCRSYDRIPYYYKAQVEGELNSEQTCTMTAELFLTWEDLYYTANELGENGYPEHVQMYVNYEGETSQVLGTCLWREETFLRFGADGYDGDIDSPDLGSVPDGLAATDMWQINEAGNVETTAGRTQIIWLKNAYAEDFMFEATLKPLSQRADGSQIMLRGDTVYGRFGLISETASGVYTVFSADARSISDRAPDARSISLQTCREIDSFHWQNQVALSQNNITDSYAGDTVTFRVIKQGDMFYYFYGDTYWRSESVPTMEEAAYCGIYTSQGVEIVDYQFVDYSGNEQALIDNLSQYVYFIDVSGEATYGTVSTSSYAVGKGDAVTISFVPHSRGVMTQLTVNGVDRYDAITEAMNEYGEYTFTPTEDTTFTATFTAFDSAALVRTVIAYYDEAGTQVREGNYRITSGNKLLYYTGTPNSSGYVILYLPKAGSYVVDGRNFSVDGKYALSTTFSSYHDMTADFTLNDDTTSVDIDGNPESVADTASFTLMCTVRENAWGAVSVNGTTVTGSGSLLYNDETDNYYIVNTSVNRYFKEMVGEDFAVDVTIDMEDVVHNNNDLAGIAVTDGSCLLVLKVNLNNGGALIVAAGSGTATTTTELAINGFGWEDSITQPDATGTELGSGTFSFRLIKSGSALYLFNSSGVLRAYFNAEGLNLVNGTGIRWGSDAQSSLNNYVKRLFADGREAAVGVRSYTGLGLRAEFAIDYSENVSDIRIDAISPGSVTVDTLSDCTLAAAYPLKAFYGIGETVEITVRPDSTRNREAQLIVTDLLGVRVIDGVYDDSTGNIVFSFLSRGGDISAAVNILTDNNIGWSADWGAFVPDRDNTIVD